MRDALAELNEEDLEYMAKVNEITEYYNGMINYYYDELNSSSDSSKIQTNKCPNCGVEVQEGYAFCDSCGTKL